MGSGPWFKSRTPGRSDCHDIEKVSAFFTDGIFLSKSRKVVTHGKEAIGSVFKTMHAALPDDRAA